MKTLIILTALLALATCFKAKAGEVSVSVSQASRDATGDKITVGDWNILQVNYQPSEDFYYFLSHEEADIMPKSYLAFKYELVGAGVGSKFKVSKNIKAFAQLGYYFVKNSWGDQRKFNESLYYFINDEFIHSGHSGNPDLPYHQFDRYIVENQKGTFAGMVGVEFNRPITKNLTIGLAISKRLLKIKESFVGTTDAWKYEETGTSWRIDRVGDYSSTNIGLKLDYAF